MGQFHSPQWQYSRESRFGVDERALMSSLRAVASGNVHAFHLEDEQAQAVAGYWVPVNRAAAVFLPWRFAAYVYRASSEGPGAALVIESRPYEHRVVIVQVAFEWEDASRPIRREDCHVPLAGWARAAAVVMLHTARPDSSEAGQMALFNVHGERVVSLPDGLSDGPSGVEARAKRRDATSARMNTAVKIYRAEMERAASEGGRARPIARVAEEMNVRRSIAARWIRFARYRGVLGAASARRAGEAPPNFPA